MIEIFWKKRAALVAQQRKIPYNEALGLVLDNFMKENSPFLKGDSPENRIIKAAKQYEDAGYDEIEAINLAKYKIALQSNKIPPDLRAKIRRR